MLSDAIQVQSVIQDPRMVLAFPGQKHAGTIEYPFQILAELVAPGNFYVHTAPRILFAFLTGFVTVKLFLTLFPKAKVWALLTAIAVGPAIIHGLSGPGGNWVGVWWLVGNYETSWLLVTTGAWLLARQLRVQTDEVNAPRNWLRCTFAGLVIGLGFFAHPNITLLIIPLATLVLILLPISWKQLLQVLIGFAVGIIPAAIFTSTGYAFFIECMEILHRNRISMAETPIDFMDRTNGESMIPKSQIFSSMSALVLLCAERAISRKNKGS